MGWFFSDRLETSSGPLWVLNVPPSSFCSSSTSFPFPSPSPSSFSSSSNTAVRFEPWLPIKSSSIPDSLWHLPAYFLFPFYWNPFLPRSTIFYMVFLFSFFLPLYMLQLLLTFVDFAFFQHLTRRKFTYFVSSPRHTSLISLLVHRIFILLTL